MSYREPLAYSRRESFSIGSVGNKITQGAQTAAKQTEQGAQTAAKQTEQGAQTAAQKTQQGLTTTVDKTKQGVLGPVWDKLKQAWSWIKYVLSVVCCLCILSCCYSLGLPQMAFKAIGEASSGG